MSEFNAPALVSTPLLEHDRGEGTADLPATLTPTRVLIADDHPLIRLGIRCELEDAGFEVCAEAPDGAGALADAIRTEPDLCLLDLNMPGGGLETARAIKESVPETKVVMLTSSEEQNDILGAILAGASGYLGKDTEPDRLPHVIRAVVRGEIVVPRAFVSTLVARLGLVPEVQAAGSRRFEDSMQDHQAPSLPA